MKRLNMYYRTKKQYFRFVEDAAERALKKQVSTRIDSETSKMATNSSRASAAVRELSVSIRYANEEKNLSRISVGLQTKVSPNRLKF